MTSFHQSDQKTSLESSVPCQKRKSFVRFHTHLSESSKVMQKCRLILSTQFKSPLLEALEEKGKASNYEWELDSKDSWGWYIELLLQALKRRIGQLTNVGSGRFLLSDAVGRCDAVAKHLRGQDVAPVRGAETCSDSGPWVPLRPLELTGPGHTNRLVPDPQSVSRWETFSKRSWVGNTAMLEATQYWPVIYYSCISPCQNHYQIVHNLCNTYRAAQ